MAIPSIVVAPMEGVTHFPMRLWLNCIAQPSSMTTPFLRVTRVYPTDELPELFAPELFDLREATAYELVPQFIASDIESFLRACELIPVTLSPLIELNCGCPSPNSMGPLAGSGILREPQAFGAMIEKACERLGPGRLAIKMRLGMKDDAEFLPLLDRIAPLPLGRLTLHTRTRADGYRGKARWEHLSEALRRCPYPIIASGDVWGLDSFRLLLETIPGLHGVMIGRGLLRNPWIFRELALAQKTQLRSETLIQALYVFLLLQHLAHKEPQKLLAKARQGQLGFLCGTDLEAWKQQAAQLSKIALGHPLLLLKGQTHIVQNLSSVAFSRLRLLWTYLRSSLPPAYAAPSLMKARTAAELFERLFEVGELEPELTLEHNPEWDTFFSKSKS